VRVGASIGVVLYPEHSVTQQEELVELADAAMYQAKHLGKNRVIFAEKTI
jgi:diguanylate cyclase (GGDEF)-like protein